MCFLILKKWIMINKFYLYDRFFVSNRNLSLYINFTSCLKFKVFPDFLVILFKILGLF